MTAASVEAADTTPARWVAVPESVYAGRQTARAVAVYAALAQHGDGRGGTVWPSQATLSGLLGCSRWTVKRALAELSAAGIVTVTTRKSSTGRRSIYELPPVVSEGRYVRLPADALHGLTRPQLRAWLRWAALCGPRGWTEASLAEFIREHGGSARDAKRRRAELVAAGLIETGARPGRPTRTALPGALPAPSAPLSTTGAKSAPPLIEPGPKLLHPRGQNCYIPGAKTATSPGPKLLHELDERTRGFELDASELDPPITSRTSVTTAREDNATHGDDHPSDSEPTPLAEARRIADALCALVEDLTGGRGGSASRRRRDLVRATVLPRLRQGWTESALYAFAQHGGYAGAEHPAAVLVHRLERATPEDRDATLAELGEDPAPRPSCGGCTQGWVDRYSDAGRVVDTAPCPTCRPATNPYPRTEGDD